MAAERPAEQTAAEAAAMVAEQVRGAIESAERSADDLQRQALQQVVTDREKVHRMAAVALEQIATVEEKVARLLQTLREDVARITDAVDRAEVAEQPAHASEPDPPAAAAGHARRRRLFGRRGASSPCAVCGRAPRPGDGALEEWRRTGKLSLCPDCQDEGWQLPPGARLPYRPARHAGSRG